MLYIMTDGMAYLIMFVLLILLVFILFLPIRLCKKITISILVVFVLIFIPIIGHSNWNKETRLSYELNHLNSGDTYVTPTEEEIIKLKHPLRIKTISSVREPFAGATMLSDEIVDINGKRYNVLLADNLYPLNFTPYETWIIGNITKSK